MKNILLLVALIAIAAIILAATGKRGGNVFKKQGVAWGLTLLMVFAAIGIGYAKAPVNNPTPGAAPHPSASLQQGPGTAPALSDSFVWDNAGVLSAQTVRTLDDRNDRLWDRYSASIGVVTCNYGRDDLDIYAQKCAEEMGLGGYDFTVVLDISGDSYWLIQGADLIRDFTNQDCSDYAYNYMESSFARGDYDSAVLRLTEMLEAWYGVYYG